MATVSNYSWRVFGDGGPDNPECKMVAYRTDPDHVPSQWQETLHGKEKQEAIIIVSHDKWVADQLQEGEGYKQTTINEEQRWYLRTSKKSSNSWEVVLDENGNEISNPCFAPTPDPRENEPVHLTDAIITFVRSGNNITITISGTEATS